MRVGLTKNFKGKLHDLMVVNSNRFATFTKIELEHQKCNVVHLCRFYRFRKKLHQIVLTLSRYVLSVPSLVSIKKEVANKNI